VVKYLHTMIRVTDPEATVAFFSLIGLREVRRTTSEQGRYTLIFLAPPGQEGIAEVELTYNWPPENGKAEEYSGGRNFGHLAYRVDNIYETCQRLMDAGVTINRPPRDGHMAFVRPTASPSNCCRTAISNRPSRGRACPIRASGKGGPPLFSPGLRPGAGLRARPGAIWQSPAPLKSANRQGRPAWLPRPAPDPAERPARR